MAFIEIKDASKVFTSANGTFEALSHVDLEIEKGEFICLLRPSGCGKSTLLNAIAGFDLATEGTITINSEAVRRPKVEDILLIAL